MTFCVQVPYSLYTPPNTCKMTFSLSIIYWQCVVINFPLSCVDDRTKSPLTWVNLSPTLYVCGYANTLLDGYYHGNDNELPDPCSVILTNVHCIFLSFTGHPRSIKMFRMCVIKSENIFSFIAISFNTLGVAYLISLIKVLAKACHTPHSQLCLVWQARTGQEIRMRYKLHQCVHYWPERWHCFVGSLTNHLRLKCG